MKKYIVYALIILSIVLLYCMVTMCERRADNARLIDSIARSPIGRTYISDAVPGGQMVVIKFDESHWIVFRSIDRHLWTRDSLGVEKYWPIYMGSAIGGHKGAEKTLREYQERDDADAHMLELLRQCLYSNQAYIILSKAFQARSLEAVYDAIATSFDEGKASSIHLKPNVEIRPTKSIP
jgi:hypothetical protein